MSRIHLTSICSSQASPPPGKTKSHQIFHHDAPLCMHQIFPKIATSMCFVSFHNLRFFAAWILGVRKLFMLSYALCSSVCFSPRHSDLSLETSIFSQRSLKKVPGNCISDYFRGPLCRRGFTLVKIRQLQCLVFFHCKVSKFSSKTSSPTQSTRYSRLARWFRG